MGGYFYTRHDMERFRKEAKEERMGSAVSPVQGALDTASSSMALFMFLIVGMLAATIACLPILLLLKTHSFLSSCTSQEDIDSSVRLSPPLTGSGTGPFIERICLGLLGNHISHKPIGIPYCQYDLQSVAPQLGD